MGIAGWIKEKHDGHVEKQAKKHGLTVEEEKQRVKDVNAKSAGGAAVGAGVIPGAGG